MPMRRQPNGLGSRQRAPASGRRRGEAMRRTTVSVVSVRIAGPGDFASLDAIREAAFVPVFASFRSLVGSAIADVAFRDAETEQRNHLRELLAPAEGRVVLLAVRDGVASGFCAISWNAETGVGEIGLNAVHPTAQRQGIASRLYAAGLERLRAAGMRIATVGTGGDDSHRPARSAYAKAGFANSIPSAYLYRAL